MANVQAGRLDLDHVTEITVPRGMAARCSPRPGDVLMTEGKLDAHYLALLPQSFQGRCYFERAGGLPDLSDSAGRRRNLGPRGR